MITGMRHRREAKRLIEEEAPKAVSVARFYGWRFDDVKGQKWFRSAVALALYEAERKAPKRDVSFTSPETD